MPEHALEWKPVAIDSLNQLDRKTKDRLFNKTEDMAKNPHHFLDPKGQLGVYALRVGDYRVIVDWDKNNNVITVLLVGHRKKVYREFQRKYD